MTTAKLLVCATDAGGARSLAPVIRALPENTACRIIASAATAGFFSSCAFEPEVRLLRSTGEACEHLAGMQPDYVLCGTTRSITSDRYVTAAARSPAP